MNDTQTELKICAGIQSVISAKPGATFQEAVNATVEEARSLGLLTGRMRVRAFFTLPAGQLYVDVRVDSGEEVKARSKRMAKKRKPSPGRLA